MSAVDYVTPLDWAWGTYTSAIINSSTIPESFSFYPDGSSPFQNNAKRVVVNKIGFTAESGYTYTYTTTFQVLNFSSYFTLCSGSQLSTVGYKYSNLPDISYPSYDLFKFDGTISSALVSIQKIDSDPDTFRLTIVFNTDNSGLTPGDIYLYASAFLKSNDSQPSPTPTFGNEIIVVKRDIDGTLFEKAVLDSLESIESSNDSYYSNALDLLEQIVNAGQGYPLPDDAASKLDQSAGNLSTAEGAVSNQSSSLADSVSDEWSSYKDQAKALVTTVKPSAVVFTTTFATVVDAFPDEVKALLVAVPLIIFIGWLIGRVKG